MPPEMKRPPGDGGRLGELHGKSSRPEDTPQAPARSTTLKSHFDRAVELLEQKAALAVDVAEWRQQARNDGLEPRILVKLAREHRRNNEQQRRAAEQAELEELYRQGLGLPLFDYAAGRAAE